MDKTVLNKLKQDLGAEILHLETELSPLQEALGRKRSQLEALERMIQIESGAVGVSAPDATNSRSQGLTDHAERLLRDTGKAVHYSELLAALEDEGVEVPGRQPGANLIAHLSRDKRFARVGSGLYALATWGIKPSPKRHRATKARRR